MQNLTTHSRLPICKISQLIRLNTVEKFMCGIVGAIAKQKIANTLIDGLKNLEYRGYDSAGIALINEKNQLKVVKRVGKLKVLQEELKSTNIDGKIGIAHTRWATHGTPSELNAHPHCSENITIVHNGIIENHQELKQLLKNKGFTFASQTDSEVIAHLIYLELQNSPSTLKAVEKAVKQLKGSYAMVVLNSNEPDQLIAAKFGSPLVIGYGDNANYVSSDPLAILSVSDSFTYLEDYDIAHINCNKVTLFDSGGNQINRKITNNNFEKNVVCKGKFKHFMQKEIFEQPKAIRQTLNDRLNNNQIDLSEISSKGIDILKQIEHIQIIACGTSFNAGLTAKYWLEEISGVSCDVEIASEFRYRKSITRKNSLLLSLSQSGETADTLAALKKAKLANFLATMTICNIKSSSLVRESDFALLTKAGVEIGVASTKSFTSQLVCLLLLTLYIAKLQQKISNKTETVFINQLQQLPDALEKILEQNDSIEKIAHDFAYKQHSLFLGRGIFYPIAMEAALKLKEISYIHAEAYAAGELKHGPLALIDNEMPVIVIAPNNNLLDKLKSNIAEVQSRGGRLYIFAEKSTEFMANNNYNLLPMPNVPEIISPIVYSVPMQLLSYHIALVKGTDVDQPRNLAKSVTVE